ncbi:phage holin family protein [Balneolales bacterium ANBcel1]|nr:phage holin family protein [Balneolales bacterium ANBcel1]
MSPAEYETLLQNLKKLPGEFKMLVEKRIELFTLEVGERISGVIAHAVYRVTGIVFLALGLILILFAAANFVGELLESEGLGFIVVAAPMLLIGLLLFLRRPRSMVTATRDKMLAQFMKDLSEQLSNIDGMDGDDTSSGTSGSRAKSRSNDRAAEAEEGAEDEGKNTGNRGSQKA